jgi:hypothetical protein
MPLGGLRSHRRNQRVATLSGGLPRSCILARCQRLTYADAEEPTKRDNSFVVTIQVTLEPRKLNGEMNTVCYQFSHEYLLFRHYHWDSGMNIIWQLGRGNLATLLFISTALIVSEYSATARWMDAPS